MIYSNDYSSIALITRDCISNNQIFHILVMKDIPTIFFIIRYFQGLEDLNFNLSSLNKLSLYFLGIFGLYSAGS